MTLLRVIVDSFLDQGWCMTLEPLNQPEWIDGGGLRGEGFQTYVRPAHRGPCAMSFHDGSRRRWAAFQSYKETEIAAAGACRSDVGGYTNVKIHPLKAVALDTQRYESALEWLFGDTEPLDAKDRPRGVAYIARIAMRDMVRKIAKNPEELLGMEWLDLERALFEALHGLGYSVRRTRSTKDGGYDLEIEIEGRRFLVEVKH